MPRHSKRYEWRLGLKQITSPFATASKVDLALMQAIFAMRPELYHSWAHAKPGPGRRATDFAALEFPSEPRKLCEKLLT